MNRCPSLRRGEEAEGTQTTGSICNALASWQHFTPLAARQRELPWQPAQHPCRTSCMPRSAQPASKGDCGRRTVTQATSALPHHATAHVVAKQRDARLSAAQSTYPRADTPTLRVGVAQRGPLRLHTAGLVGSGCAAPSYALSVASRTSPRTPNLRQSPCNAPRRAPPRALEAHLPANLVM